MKKYRDLYDFLKLQDSEKIEMTFSEVEELIYNKLPKSAFKHRQWWANGGHVQAYAWMDAGYLVKKVNFKDLVNIVIYTRTNKSMLWAD